MKGTKVGPLTTDADTEFENNLWKIKLKMNEAGAVCS